MIMVFDACLRATKLRMSSFFIPFRKHLFNRQAEQCRRVVIVISHLLFARHVKRT